MRWRIETFWATAGDYPWEVNSRGQTYGASIPYGQPDLLSVNTTDGRGGYLDLAEVSRMDSRPGPNPRRVPVYASDGTTVVGEYARS